MRLRICVMVSCCIFWVGGAQADIGLGVKASNVPQGEVDAIVELFRGAYSEQAGDQVVVIHEGVAALDRVELSIVKAGQRIQVRAARYHGGRLEHSEKALLSSIDEAPEVTDRLARAVYRGTSFQSTANNENITQEEAQEPLKKESDISSGFRAGVMVPYTPIQEFNAYFMMGYDGRFESGFLALEFGIGGAFPFPRDPYEPGEDQRWLTGGMYTDLGLSIYAAPKSAVSPYIGIGVMPRLWFSQRYFGPNILPYAQAGLSLMRNYSVRFFAEARGGYNVSSIGYNSQSETIRPWEFGGALGVGF